MTPRHKLVAADEVQSRQARSLEEPRAESYNHGDLEQFAMHGPINDPQLEKEQRDNNASAIGC
jgi:hypothetical protein